ncbi:MAG: hypothetical protein FRX48_08837 [Lasallia pustulata]|uniref:Amidohydrolase-related domain-containing protein n=1 Tax=Lasallia pustulata TaxID=136370 RepID=A0A5M8PD90_9LECA|nr:MAG: hypothetical protein FRX48_08837 [Lasallia pustulata]
MSLAALASFQLSLANTAGQWLCTPQAQMPQVQMPQAQIPQPEISPAAAPKVDKHIIYNVNVFDGEKLAPFNRVVISGGMIVPDKDTAGATTEDGKGAFLLPGFFDAHAHVYGPCALRVFRDYGVTTALDMGTFPYQDAIASLRAMSDKGYTAVYGSGAAATEAGGFLSGIPGFPEDSYVTSPKDAVSFVQARVKEGVDYIKIFINETSEPGLNLQRIIVGSANANNLRVVSHATSDQAYGEAANANGLFITHAPRDQTLSPARISRIVANKQVSIPTLIKMRNLVNMQHQPKNYTFSRDSVTAMYNAKVPILVGTDCDDGKPFVPYEGTLQVEMELLVEAKMTTIDVLKGATSLPAMYFNLTDRGMIAPGKRADMVLLNGNPLTNISKTKEVLKVWIGGAPSVPS